MEVRIPSGEITLVADLARPSNRADVSQVPAVILVHGFPSEVKDAAMAAAALPELGDRIAAEMGWIALALAFRGCGTSEGSFSLQGWLDDLLAAVDWLEANEAVTGVWLAGLGTGGAVSVCAAARNPRVRGVATLGAPADFDDWASHPRRLLEYSKEVGLIRDPDFPSSFSSWSRELRDLRAVAHAPAVAPRPMLVVHGSEDDLVPSFDARVLVDAHGQAELRMVAGAGHRLRHDPRAIAILLGWLDRCRNRSGG